MMDAENAAPTRTRARPDADEDGAIPIYAEIQRDIERKIMSGEWAPGTRIPSELELVDTYGCSRMTVNKALSSLAAAGMITRKRRSGSHVAPPRLDEPLMYIQDIRAEVMSIDRIYSYKILTRSVRDVNEPTDARHVGVPLGTRMLYLEVMHFADALPFTMETRQINLSAVPEIEDATFSPDEPPGTWLLRNVPWSEGEHSIRAISADAMIAKRLQISEHAACISIARRTWRDKDLITFVRLIYPGDRHRFVVRFTPNAMGGPAPR